MKTFITTRLLAVLLSVAFTTHTFAQGTAFTYQGRLNDGANAANGSYDLTFALFSVSSGAGQVGNTLTNSATAVTNGLFTVALDFVANFPGADRWLQIAVRTNGAGAFTNLAPRQKITATPYAVQALGAANAASYFGAISDVQLSANIARLNTSGQTFNGPVLFVSSGNIFTGNGAGLTALNASNIASGTLPDARLSANVALLNTNQTFTGSNNFNGALVATNLNSRFAGDGGGLTNLNSSGISGAIPDARLSTNVALLNVSQTFTGRPAFNSAGAPLAVGNTTLVNNLNADLIDGFSANASPTASTLLPLNASAKFPNSVLSTGSGNGLDADTVDGFHAASFWRLSGNSSTTPGTHFLGTTDNQALEFKVNGVRALRLEPNASGPNVIGGNSSSVSAVFGHNVIGGGESHSITGTYGNSVIAGGYANLIGDTLGGSFFLSGGANAIGGGVANNIQSNANFSTIAGGESNTVLTNAGWAAIGGGYNNDIGVGAQYATIPGGRDNDADGDYSFAAGRRAKANHDGAFVWADSQNADFSSTSSNQFLIRASGGVGIGTASPAYTFDVLAGQAVARFTTTNSVNGSVIVLENLTSSPTYYGAINFRNSGNGQIGYLTNDNMTFRTASGERLRIDGSGKVGIGTNSPQSALHVVGTVTATAFNPPSDRNLKENFKAVSPQTVLERVAAMPLAEWNFKEDPAVRHLGPMAQDFHAAFGLGTDERHIATVDADGVALAAIQGLNEKVERGKRKAEASIEELRAENAELKARLEKLEKLVNNGGGK